MTLDYQAAIAFTVRGDRRAYTHKDAMLYGLGLGVGADPLDRRALQYVYEGGGRPRVLPTFPVVLPTSYTAALGVQLAQLLHGEQRLTLHAPLPAEGVVVCDTRTLSIIDKGAERGAIVNVEVTGATEQGTPLFTILKTLFARGDGGCGAPPGEAMERHRIPDRAPDAEHVIATLPGQALLYRLSGDTNPLHADPATARRAGFDRPILHGLCTYGIAARAILETVCDDPARFRHFDVRFTAPVYPGETLATQIWHDGSVISFRCRVTERDVMVIDNGRCVLTDA